MSTIEQLQTPLCRGSQTGSETCRMAFCVQHHEPTLKPRHQTTETTTASSNNVSFLRQNYQRESEQGGTNVLFSLMNISVLSDGDRRGVARPAPLRTFPFLCEFTALEKSINSFVFVNLSDRETSFMTTTGKRND